ncbi:hypothetical protein KPSB59_4270004 [Klebsiella quasipneumoniae subsp. quasipneumoniae]|nr:hypothetical protein KPSB59_4270004 [Klebsiella quasipneumoniae subsp. quasipneumoniae]
MLVVLLALVLSRVEQAEPQSLTALADWAETVVRNQGLLHWLAGKAVFLLVDRLTFPEVTALMGKMAP